MRTVEQEYHPAYNVDELQEHPENPNRGDDALVAELIDANGFYGAVIAQRSTRRIIAGHTRWRAARANGAATLPVLLVDVDDDEAKRIMVGDNRARDTAVTDFDQLTNLLSDLSSRTGSLAGTGYSRDDLTTLLDELAAPPPGGGDENAETLNPYTMDIALPHYEPTMERPPSIDEVIDTSRTRALIAEIENTPGLDDDTRALLIACAHRHTRIRFDKAAELYAHASPEVQRLMEAQILVIVDFDEAIGRGYAKMNKRLNELFAATPAGDLDDEQPSDLFGEELEVES